MADFTIATLAAELGVSRRTIEREIKSGALVPTCRTVGGRARFRYEFASALKARVEEARRAGHKRVMDLLPSSDPVLGPRRKRKAPPVSAQEWVRRANWKLQNLSRNRRQPASSGAGSLPTADGEAATDAARKTQSATANKSSRLLGMKIRGLSERPTSKEQAIAMLRAVENIARHEYGVHADHIRKIAARLGYRLKRRDPDKRDVLDLKVVLSHSVSLEREPHHFLATAIPNLIAWYEGVED